MPNGWTPQESERLRRIHTPDAEWGDVDKTYIYTDEGRRQYDAEHPEQAEQAEDDDGGE